MTSRSRPLTAAALLGFDGAIVAIDEAAGGALTLTLRHDTCPEVAAGRPRCHLCRRRKPRRGRYADFPLRGRPCVLKLTIFLCPAAAAAPLPAELLPGWRMTASLLEHLAVLCCRRPLAAVSLDTGVRANTLGQLLRRLEAELLGAYRPPAPRVLGIDGVHTGGAVRTTLAALLP